MEALLPPEVSPLVAAGLMAASFIASLITAAFGIGGGIVMIAILASLLPPSALIPVHAVVQVGSNAGRALIMRAHIDWPTWGAFLIGTAVGVAIGGVVAIDLPAAWIQIGIGLFVLWTIFFKPPGALRHSAWLAGGISSVLTMFFGATGPFVAAYLKTRRYDRMTQVAMQGACMTAQHLLKAVAFGVLGFGFGPYVLLVAGLIAFGFLGTLAGKRVLMKIDEARFRAILNAILVALSLRLIWAGSSALV